MSYQPYSVDQLLEGQFDNVAVETKGIARGITSPNHKDFYGYLQSGTKFLPIYGHVNVDFAANTVNVLMASSQANIEVTVRGDFTTKQGAFLHPADLKVEEVVLANVGDCIFSKRRFSE